MEIKTVPVTLAGKGYRATGFTLGELGEIVRIDTAIKEAGNERDLPKIYALYCEAMEIICSSIRRSGSDVPTEEVKKESPTDDIEKAVVTLLNFRPSSDVVDDPSCDDEFPTRVQ
ncbi:MAG TPA: hypothetical protein VOA88_16685 [Candidatus Dormibacteraeota bacterium]|nr:hypothetical protein [Candidatus Dormibacteraeota bacterium]